MKLDQAIAEPKGLANRAAWLATAKVIALVLAFLLPLVLVRGLSRGEFGLYKQSFQILSTTVSLLCLQVSASAYYFMPRQPHRKPQVAMNVLLFYLGVGSALALFFALYPRWVTHIFHGDGLVPVVPMLGLVILFWLVATNLEGIAIANGDIRWSSAVIVAMQVLKTSLLILAGIVFGSIQALIIAALLIGSVHCAIFFIYLRRRFGRFWWPIDWQLFRAQLANSLPFGIGSIAYIIQYDLHNYYVSYYFSPADFAIYAVGCFQLPLLLVLFDSVDTVLFPEVARLEKEGAYDRIIGVWVKAMRLLAFVFFPTCALLLVVRQELIVTLFTAEYAAAAPIFAVNLFNLLLWLGLTGPVLRAFVEFKYFRFKLYLVLLPVSFFALYAGIQMAGLLGAIAAVAFTRGLDVAITMTLLGRRLGMGREDLRRFAPLLRLFAAAALAGLVTWTAKAALTPLPMIAILALCALIFGIVYLLAAFSFGAVSGEEKEYLRRLWRDRAGGSDLPAASSTAQKVTSVASVPAVSEATEAR